MERTESEMIAVGTYVKDVLLSDTFNALYKEYTDAMLSAIVSSQPHEAKLREFEYAKTQAMTGFVNHLVGLAAAADKLIKKNEQQNEDHADEDEGASYDVED
jgi:hypothetical protein